MNEIKQTIECLQAQNQSMLKNFNLLMSESREERGKRERREEIEREAYSWIHGGNSIHGPI